MTMLDLDPPPTARNRLGTIAQRDTGQAPLPSLVRLDGAAPP